MALAHLNQLKPADREAVLGRCCGSAAWVRHLNALFPFPSAGELLAAAQSVWYRCREKDWREAFAHHPRIGDLDSLREKYGGALAWAAGEQAAMQHTSEEVLQQLARGNEAYEARFGYIFIVCATGKSAEEMLDLLRARLSNPPETEIKIAMEEQNKITKLRLEKLLAA